MEDVARYFLSMKLLAHRAHHDVVGPNFFSDHKEFGKLYEAYDSAYDSTVERIKGLGSNPDLAALAVDAAREAAKYCPKTVEPRPLWKCILNCEKELRKLCESSMSKATEGTKNLLAQFCDDSEQRCFLIQGRLGV